MSSDWKNLEAEFKKFRLEEIQPLREESVISCSGPNISIKSSSLLEVTGKSMKAKDKKATHCSIKPVRLKLIGHCVAKKLKNDFTSEAFLKMRIFTSSATCEKKNPLCSQPPVVQERLPLTSSFSTQAKLQQQLSSTTEFDSTIDEMSEFLAYHLSLFNHRYDSMYT